MTPAPYTRETVAHIRSRAAMTEEHVLAIELGWDVARLRDLARKHAIDLLKPKVENKPVMRETPSDELLASLPRSQGELVRLLLSTLHEPRWLHSADIGRRMQIGEQGVQCLRMRTNVRLQDSGWTIEARRGSHGGYKLVRA